MKRPAKIAYIGAVLVATTFAVCAFYLHLQQPPDANWSVTQKRMADIARSLAMRQSMTWAHLWPRTLQPTDLSSSKGEDLIFRDEWNHPLIYRPYGDTSYAAAEPQMSQRASPKAFGEQMLDWSRSGHAAWTKGEDGWEPNPFSDGWIRHNPDGSASCMGASVQYFEIVSYGKDGTCGGDGVDKDIVLRMSASRDGRRTQSRIGGTLTLTQRFSWKFVED